MEVDNTIIRPIVFLKNTHSLQLKSEILEGHDEVLAAGFLYNITIIVYERDEKMISSYLIAELDSKIDSIFEHASFEKDDKVGVQNFIQRPLDLFYPFEKDFLFFCDGKFMTEAEYNEQITLWFEMKN